MIKKNIKTASVPSLRGWINNYNYQSIAYTEYSICLFKNSSSQKWERCIKFYWLLKREYEFTYHLHYGLNIVEDRRNILDYAKKSYDCNTQITLKCYL